MESKNIKRFTVLQFQRMKARGEPIPMVTAYDYTHAKLADIAGIPSILVGDSLGNVVLGHKTTIPVTVDDMCSATAAVCRGASRALVIGDMPFMSYQPDISTAMRNAARLMQEGGAHAVKLEGGIFVESTIRALVDAGIPVMGHVGFTPQSFHSFGGYRVQGKGDSAERVVKDAIAVQHAGAFAVVLELMPAELAERITSQLDIPTIGIGAGPHCDGQIQVLHDLLGLDPDFKPRHAGNYANISSIITEALSTYAADVRLGKFPMEEQSH